MADFSQGKSSGRAATAGGGDTAADVAIAQASFDGFACQQTGQETRVERVAGASRIDHFHIQGGRMPDLVPTPGVGTLPSAFENDQRAKFRQAGQGGQWFRFTGQLAGFAQVGRKDIHLSQGFGQVGIGQAGRGVLAIDENPATLLVDQIHQGPALD